MLIDFVINCIGDEEASCRLSLGAEDLHPILLLRVRVDPKGPFAGSINLRPHDPHV